MALPVLTNHTAPEPASGRVSFFSFTRAELADYLGELFGFSSYRANQLFQWVYQKEIYDLAPMTNIKKSDRELLEETFAFSDLEYSNRQVSVDGTRKYLIPVSQGHHVESVMIKQPTRMTLCVSSQVGCALGCKFCQTGTMGLIRHL
ncbi:MAG: 23S rRNA (adenine(2503)-C2)-methyltransferase, partial [Bdellovibrionales bacterium]|nr:23S rRNA (adenine(2503)-C2)-methyltransferase [Bdellovibrionales bacterium]